MIEVALALGIVVAASGPAFEGARARVRERIRRWRDFPSARVEWSTPAAIGASIGADLATGKDRAKITPDGQIPIRPRNP